MIGRRRNFLLDKEKTHCEKLTYEMSMSRQYFVTTYYSHV